MLFSPINQSSPTRPRWLKSASPAPVWLGRAHLTPKLRILSSTTLQSPILAPNQAPNPRYDAQGHAAGLSGNSQLSARPSGNQTARMYPPVHFDEYPASSGGQTARASVTDPHERFLLQALESGGSPSGCKSFSAEFNPSERGSIDNSRRSIPHLADDANGSDAKSASASSPYCRQRQTPARSSIPSARISRKSIQDQDLAESATEAKKLAHEQKNKRKSEESMRRSRGSEDSVPSSARDCTVNHSVNKLREKNGELKAKMRGLAKTNMENARELAKRSSELKKAQKRIIMLEQELDRSAVVRNQLESQLKHEHFQCISAQLMLKEIQRRSDRQNAQSMQEVPAAVQPDLLVRLEALRAELGIACAALSKLPASGRAEDELEMVDLGGESIFQMPAIDSAQISSEDEFHGQLDSPEPPGDKKALAKPLRDQSDASPMCNRSDTSPRCNRSDASPMCYRSDASPKYNQTDRSPDYNQADASPKYNQADASPNYNRTDASPNYNQADASPKYNQTDTSPKYTQADASPKYHQADASPKYNQTDTSSKYTQADASPKYHQADASLKCNQRTAYSWMESSEMHTSDDDRVDDAHRAFAPETRLAPTSMSDSVLKTMPRFGSAAEGGSTPMLSQVQLSKTSSSSSNPRAYKLQNISLRDLSEIKALKRPPESIQLLMEVCCLLMNIDPDRSRNNAGEVAYDYWEPARRMILSDPFFLSKLRLIEASDISKDVWAKINDYFGRRAFTTERMKKCSKPALSLFEWLKGLQLQREGDAPHDESPRK